jgi:pimeloyl-ACP methyl ester carboxylesterase
MPEINYHRVGSGPPLVLLHPIGTHWQIWRPVLDQLAAEREVIAPDMPGFGATPRPPEGVPAGAPTLARAVADLLDELGIERPHLAGNSLGGLVSLELAKMGRAASVTAISPAGFHNDQEEKFQRLTLTATVRAARLLRPYLDPLLATALVRTVLGAQLVARGWRMPAADMAEHFRALADATWLDETMDAIFATPFSGGERIEVPVTIAWGQHDRLLLLRQAPRARAAVPGARLVTLYGCGHVPMYDDPEQVARVLLEASRQGAA